MRRSTVLVLAAAALVIAACEIRTNYDLAIADDTSAMLAFEISYDEEAAQLFGPAEDFLEDEIEGDLGSEIDGVTLVSAEADSSDPENQRVTAVFEARDGEAFDRLVDDLFLGSSFTSDDGTTWTLTLSPDTDITEDFGEEFPLDEIGLDFISGEVRVDHAGSQVSMTGGTAEGGNVVVWDPYGPDDLEVVMDLSGASPPAAEDDEVEEPAEEPVDEVEEEATDEVEEPAEEPEEQAPVAVVDLEDDEGGLSTLLLGAIIGGALLLLALLLLLLRGRGKEQETAAVAAGAPTGTAAAPGAWDQTQGTTQQWDGSPPPASQWDQTQELGPTPQGTPQPPPGAPPPSASPPSASPPSASPPSAPPAAPSSPPPDRPQPPTPPPPPVG